MTNKTDSVLFFFNINYIFSSDIYNKWKVITGIDRGQLFTGGENE